MSATQPGAPVVEAWIADVIIRHTQAFSRPEFLKAARALSARYVERRRDLPSRSPIDSAGKRAAFAALFAPLHFLTVAGLVPHLTGLDCDELIDLGCGTGVASAAWARAMTHPPPISGVDRDGRMAKEASWNWTRLGLSGRVQRSDMVATAAALVRTGGERRRGIVLGWSVNELSDEDRSRLLAAVCRLVERRASILIVEPLSRAASPWWDAWATALAPHGAQAREWKLPAMLPSALAELDEAAGFRRDVLGARSLWLPAGRDDF